MQLGGSKRLGAQKLNRSFSEIEKQADQQQHEAALVQHTSEADKERVQSRLACSYCCVCPSTQSREHVRSVDGEIQTWPPMLLILKLHYG